ncbi:hypothetical protein ACIHFD_65390 [Nonomuraea sp. NPDC051941]|uniref:hypothetical protein n=1 Tax=Nonomuraea sp. NPDC051941 TaxID=3364373 RepID=UPI0037C5296C
MFELMMPVGELDVRSRSPLFVAGRIWVAIDGVDFPSAGWTDSPISVLGSLGVAIHAVHRGEAGEAGEVYLLGGPYYLKLIPKNSLDSTSSKIDVVAVCVTRDVMESQLDELVEAGILARVHTSSSSPWYRLS